MLCGAGATLLHNNLGGQGSGDDYDPPSQLPGCEGRSKTDDCSLAMGALALSTQSPEGLGPASPCASRRACAVIGNVVRPDQLTDLTEGVGIDLWVETTTPYERAGRNFMRTKDDVPTFGEINLAGADTDGEQATVGLKFTFKRNDNGQEVTIPFMQITLFDFDHNMNDGTTGREVPRSTPPPRPPHPTPTPNPQPPTPNPQTLNYQRQQQVSVEGARAIIDAIRYKKCHAGLNPTPQTLHPKPSTLDPKLYTPNPQPLTLNSKP